MRRRVILNIVHENGGTMERNELRQKLVDLHKIGKWGLGPVRTMILIEEMVKNGVLHAVKSQGGKKILITS